MKTETEIRERMETLMNTLKRTDDDRKILTMAAVLKELEWVLE
jgi:uncharacterized protein (UPF0371 family)